MHTQNYVDISVLLTAVTNLNYTLIIYKIIPRIPEDVKGLKSDIGYHRLSLPTTLVWMILYLPYDNIT